MATIKAFRDKWTKYYGDLPALIADEVEKTKDVLLDLNRDQLLYGRDAKGEVLTPGYMDDPYFEGDLKAASKYMNRKKKLEDKHWNRIKFRDAGLFPDKSGDTPNLLINGNWFMNHLLIDVNKDKYTISSTGIAADDIQRKYAGYGHPVYGFAPVSVNYYYFGYLRPNAIIGNYKKYMSK
jgi:hypothetical protein